MTEQIIRLDPRTAPRYRAITKGECTVSTSNSAIQQTALPEPQPCDFQFWTGASGKRYVHSVYPLLTCPVLPAGNYVLVRRDPTGVQTTLAVGRTIEKAPSLNLAHIRQLAATIGANEVHVHLLATDAKSAKLVEFDIRTANIGEFQCSLACH